MLKCAILDVQGFRPAIEGMRNPLNSWAKSDSVFCHPEGCTFCDFQCDCSNDSVDWSDPDMDFCLGQNDLKLMNNLFKAGTEHRKFDRMIQVWMNIKAPLYWWKEFDTYKVGTVANSCSTMHKIHSKEFTLDDFSFEHLNDWSMNHLETTISILNDYRYRFNETGDKDYWWKMIQLLPCSYNQTRTVMLNYEVVARIIEQRENHKLDEWNQLIDALKNLPYLQEIMG